MQSEAFTETLHPTERKVLEFAKGREKEARAFSVLGMSLKDRTFTEEADHWLQDGKIRFSPSHFKRAQAVVDSFKKIYGDWTIDKFTPDLLSRIQREEKSKRLKNQKVMADATVNRKTEVINAILNFSAKQRRIPYNPSVGFRKLRSQAPEMAHWEEAEAISFLSEMNERHPFGSPARWQYVVYLLALNTAMRAEEIWGLQVHDLTARDTIWVRRQFNRVQLAFTSTKGTKPRHVPLSADLRYELESLIEQHKLADSDTIFRNEQSNPICHDNFADRNFLKDLKAWEGRKIRFHDLRHTAITLMVAKGIDIKTVKEICGHKDISTTMNYVHLVAENIGKVTQMFNLQPRNGWGGAEIKVSLSEAE